jgi:hypothetical protein
MGEGEFDGMADVDVWVVAKLMRLKVIPFPFSPSPTLPLRLVSG